MPVNVANAPGVPAVAFNTSLAVPELLTNDQVSQFSAVFGPQWGIFLNGAVVITAESVVGMEQRVEYTVSDYPIEGGVFESYDKVLVPFLAKVRFASGSSVEAREALLNSINAAVGTLSLYDVVTPEFTYSGCTISHYDYRREAEKGVGLIVIDVWLTQVIVQNSTGLSASQVQNPASADSSQGGLVQPTTNVAPDALPTSFA